MNNKYKCDHTPGSPRTDEQTLDLICRGCIRAYMQREKAMLAFIESISNYFNFNESEYEFMKFYTEKEYEAGNLLKEMDRKL